MGKKTEKMRQLFQNFSLPNEENLPAPTSNTELIPVTVDGKKIYLPKDSSPDEIAGVAGIPGDQHLRQLSKEGVSFEPDPRVKLKGGESFVSSQDRTGG